MLVYRLCRKDEIDNIMKDKSFKNVGTLGKVYKKEDGEVDLNTHHYEEDKYYMHFFPKLEYIFYLPVEKDMYLCYYDIPEDILNEGIGKGEYKDYFSMGFTRKVDEYAVDSEKIKFEFLEKIDYINDNIPVEEFFADESLSSFLETVYPKEKQKQI